MFATFYSFYLALFTGTWTAYTIAEARQALAAAWQDALNLIVNALGGSFQTAETLTATAQPEQVWACVLSLATLTGLALLVWKLTKYIFQIFFGGFSR